MKVYSIGREDGCDIVINDNSDVISRRHATLNVSQSGKMTIVDLSHNGTYVNGIRITQNVPVPVTRKDNVSFAHVARLDWNMIPNTGATIIRWVAIGVIALLLVIGGVWGYNTWSGSSSTSDGNSTPVASIDSTELKKERERIEEVKKHERDSIQKHIQDSLNKLHQKKTPIKKGSGKANEPKKDDAKKKEEPTTKRQRG